MSFPIKTSRSVEKGKGPASSSSKDAPGAKHGPPYKIWHVCWERKVYEKPDGTVKYENADGYTTSQLDVNVCEELGFSTTLFAELKSITDLQLQKAKLIDWEQSILEPGQPRKTGQQKKRRDPKTAMYWITPKGVLDKVGHENEATALTLGLAVKMHDDLCQYIKETVDQGWAADFNIQNKRADPDRAAKSLEFLVCLRERFQESGLSVDFINEIKNPDQPPEEPASDEPEESPTPSES